MSKEPKLFVNVQGLRTLVVGSRVVSEEDWMAWNERYQAAASLLNDRDAQVESVAQEIERDLELLGVTAIEDKLQVRKSCGVTYVVVSRERLKGLVWTSNHLPRDPADRRSFVRSLLFHTQCKISGNPIDLLDVVIKEQERRSKQPPAYAHSHMGLSYHNTIWTVAAS